MKITIGTQYESPSDTDLKILKDVINLLAQYKEGTVTMDYENHVMFRDE